MNLTNKTVLITGGNSGIGFATAKRLIAQGSKVIITGRDVAKLEKAGKELGVAVVPLDITKEEDVTKLVAILESSYSDLSILINNAGVGKVYKLGEGAGAYAIAKEEFETNYFGPVRLIEALLPLLKKQPEAAIVNVSSQVALVPLVVLPSYSDTKAALHSHSIALKLTLSKETNIKVFEVFPALIDTEGTRAMGMTNGIPANVAAEVIVEGIENDNYEIYIGDAGNQRDEFFSDPEATIEAFNKGLY